MNIRDIRLNANMTRKEFTEYFKIPKRTIENWEGGQRNPPEYVVELIKYKIEKERLGMLRLVEMDHGEVKTTIEGTLGEIVGCLKENKEIYTWMLDEDPKIEMPDFEDVKTLRELEYELEKVNLSWWSLVIE